MKTTVQLISENNQLSLVILNDHPTIHFETISFDTKSLKDHQFFIISSLTPSPRNLLSICSFIQKNYRYLQKKRIILLFPARILVSNRQLKKTRQVYQKLLVKIKKYLSDSDVRLLYVADLEEVIFSDYGYLVLNQQNKSLISLSSKHDQAIYPISNNELQKLLEIACFKPSLKNKIVVMLGQEEVLSSELVQAIAKQTSSTIKYTRRQRKNLTLVPQDALPLIAPRSPLAIKETQSIKVKSEKSQRINNKLYSQLNVKNVVLLYKKILTLSLKLSAKKIAVAAIAIVLISLLMWAPLIMSDSLLKRSEKLLDNCLNASICNENQSLIQTIETVLKTNYQIVTASRSISVTMLQKKLLVPIAEKLIQAKINAYMVDILRSSYTFFEYASGTKNNIPPLSVLNNSIDKLEYVLVNNGKDLDVLAKLTQYKSVVRAFESINSLDNLQISVVVQNSQELRPTGGFISGIANLNFQRGQLVNTTIYDVYELDDKLRGAVATPSDLNRFLNEKNWYLRDANWNPLISKSALDIAWFLEKEVGKKPDVIMFLNTITIKEILSHVSGIDLGPITVTSNNIDSLLIDPELSSIQDKPIELTVVDRLIYYLAHQASSKEIVAIGSTLLDHLARQELNIIPVSEVVESSINQSWAVMYPPAKNQCTLVEESCYDVFIYINEANIGINKTNYFIERRTSYTHTISNQMLESKLTTSIENNASSNNWPLGSYKAYLRALLPSTMQIESISINGQEVDAQNIILQATDSYVIVGVGTNTPIKSKTDVVITTKLPLALIENPQKIRIHTIKQPGIKSLNLSAISQDESLLKLRPPLSEKNQTTQIDQKSTSSTFYDIEFLNIL